MSDSFHALLAAVMPDERVRAAIVGIYYPPPPLGVRIDEGAHLDSEGRIVRDMRAPVAAGGAS